MIMQMEEEQEKSILEFSENNYSNYYVQSQSSVSHANYITTTTATTETELLSHNNAINPQFLLITMPNYCHSPLHEHDHQPLLNRDTSLSRCSSSSTSFFHDDNKSNNNNNNDNNVTSPVDAVDRVKNVVHNSVGKNSNPSIRATATVKKLRKVDDEDDEEDEWYNYEEKNDDGGGKESSYWQYLSFRTHPSCIWIALQLLWRLLLSVMLALLVFYIVTMPPPPQVSLQVTGVNQFELTQGLDLTGVATTFLSCNISMALTIDNKSKVFGLHILSPTVNVYFDRIPFVLSQGPRLYVKSQEWREMEVYGGTNRRAMYGGGRNMEDMLNSGRGLPLLVTLNFSSYFRVVANLIHSHFHHHAQCLLILHNLHDKNHRTPTYNTTCLVNS